MESKGSQVLFEIVNVVAFIAILLFAVFPKDLRAHQNPKVVDSVSISHEDHDPSHAHKELEAQTGHCHPGIDCFVAAIFSQDTEILLSQKLSPASDFFVRRNGKSWVLLQEPPPPQYWS